MTFAEVKAAEEKYTLAKKDYNAAVYDFLAQSLKDAGFYNVAVRVKGSDRKGVLKVESGSFKPFEIKFYPLKKYGGISQVSRGVYPLYSFKVLSDNCVEHLKSIFEVVSDES